MTFYVVLVEGVACNTIFSWLLLKTIMASILANKNILVSELLGDHFKLEVMVAQRSKEAPKTSERISVSLPVLIPETQNDTEYRGSLDSTVKLMNKLIHQR